MNRKVKFDEGDLRLGIYHNVIAPYKVIFFEAIARQFPGIVTLFTSSKFRTPRPEWGEQEIKANNLEVKRLPAFSLFPIIWYNPGIFPKAFVKDFDVLMTGDFMFLSAMLTQYAARLKKVPTILYTVETKLSSYFSFNLFLRETITKYDRYIVPSETTIQVLQKMGVSMEKIVKIFNPVDINKFRPRKELKRKLKKRWGLNEDDVVISYVGHLSRNKGLDYLIKAISLIDENLRLIIAGDGPMSGELKILASKAKVRNKIVFLGYVNHNRIPLIHAISDIFTLPSIPYKGAIEQFPNALLEAMSSGLPCVTFDVGGGIREIHEDGLTGTKATKITPEHLADALKRLLHSNMQLMGKKAREKIVRNFNPDTIGKLYVKTILDTLQRY